MITQLRTYVYRLLGDLLMAGGVVVLLWDGPDALLARHLTWQVAAAVVLVLGGLVVIWRAAAAALRLEAWRSRAGRSLSELEQALDAERFKVTSLSAELDRAKGAERRTDRRVLLRGAIGRRLGTIEAVALAMARELKAAAEGTGPMKADGAARRGAHWAEQLARLASGGRAREQQTNLPQIWPRVQALVALKVLPQHTVRAHMPGFMPPVAGSGESWVQVLTALVENALEAMPNGGTVEVRTEAGQREGFGRVIVADMGRGMTQEQVSAVIRLDPSRPGVGEGMGLATVIGIVEGLGGEFTLESAPGEGTRVELEVPIVVPPQPTGEEELEFEGRVLVADDDDQVRSVVARLLERLGLDVVAVDSGSMARTHLLSAAPGYYRAAVMDIVMPGVPVEDVIVSVRQKDPAFPILLMSGYDTMQMVDAVMALGGIRFLRKPFGRSDVQHALRDLFSIAPIERV